MQLSRSAQEILEIIRQMVGEMTERKEAVHFTRRDVRQYSGWHDHRVRDALQELVDMEYVVVVRGTQGQTFPVPPGAGRRRGRLAALRADDAGATGGHADAEIVNFAGSQRHFAGRLKRRGYNKGRSPRGTSPLRRETLDTLSSADENRLREEAAAVSGGPEN